jgi:hypothetical protein
MPVVFEHGRIIGVSLLKSIRNQLLHGHLHFYALLRMLRNPLAVHWTRLPLVG